jgi:DNA gyrase/topoisomerase IV subunit A
VLLSFLSSITFPSKLKRQTSELSTATKAACHCSSIQPQLKTGVDPDAVIASLFKHTRLETRFACNMVALVDGSPKQLGLKDFLQHFLDFR